MYKNAGSKIEVAAKIVCLLGIIASIIVAIVYYNSSTQYSELYEQLFGEAVEEKQRVVTVYALLIGLGGSVASWLVGLLFAGFGQLIENSDVTRIKAALEMLIIYSLDKPNKLSRSCKRVIQHWHILDTNCYIIPLCNLCKSCKIVDVEIPRFLYSVKVDITCTVGHHGVNNPILTAENGSSRD